MTKHALKHFEKYSILYSFEQQADRQWVGNGFALTGGSFGFLSY